MGKFYMWYTSFAYRKVAQAGVLGLVMASMVFALLVLPFTTKTAFAATCKDPALIIHVQNTWNQQHEWKARVSTSSSNYGKHYKVTRPNGQDISKILTKENLGTGSNYVDYWVSSYWRWWYGLANNESVLFWRNC